MDQYTQIPDCKYEINKSGDIRRVFKNGNISHLKHHLNKNGYYQVCIHKKWKWVHRLLAIVFISNDFNKPCVDHIDRNRTNNNLNNLRWVTYSENNNNKSDSVGSVLKTFDKVNGKIYEGWRASYYFNNKKISKRFKTKELCDEFILTNLGQNYPRV
tara:strand:+ start:82 stop:552 length:471 start_codon:yes stop_codon:yes gene_type:complete